MASPFDGTDRQFDGSNEHSLISCTIPASPARPRFRPIEAILARIGRGALAGFALNCRAVEQRLPARWPPSKDGAAPPIEGSKWPREYTLASTLPLHRLPADVAPAEAVRPSDAVDRRI